MTIKYSSNLDREETTPRLNRLRDLPTKWNSIKELTKKGSLKIKLYNMKQSKQLVVVKVYNANEKPNKTIKP